jgi:hypothetical protein
MAISWRRRVARDEVTDKGLPLPIQRNKRSKDGNPCRLRKPQIRSIWVDHSSLVLLGLKTLRTSPIQCQPQLIQPLPLLHRSTVGGGSTAELLAKQFAYASRGRDWTTQRDYYRPPSL